MDNRISHLASKDVDLEDEFFSFLMKAKANFENSSPESLISPLESENNDLEEKFSLFLAQTKENLDRLDSESDSSQGEDGESDAVFMQFIAQVKKDLPDHLEKENQSPFSSKCSSPQRKQRFFSVKTDDNKDSDLIERRCKSVSIDVSFDLSDEGGKATADFARKRETYSRQLYNYFNRKVFNNRLQEDMVITWSELLRNTAGRTHCKRKDDVYSCSIELSSKVLTSFDRLRDTLLHEMCHAAVWVVNKSRDKHGPLWQTWASRCKLILPNIDLPSRCHNYEIEYRFTYKCNKCQWKCGRHSRSIKLKNVVCPQCSSPLTLIKS